MGEGGDWMLGGLSDFVFNTKARRTRRKTFVSEKTDLQMFLHVEHRLHTQPVWVWHKFFVLNFVSFVTFVPSC